MRTNRLILAVTTMALAALQPVGISAALVGNDGPLPAARHSHAGEMEGVAYGYMAQNTKLREAARLLTEAALARSETDPKRFSNKLLAGRLYYLAGDRRRAQQMLEQAAEQALSMGLVVDAAHAYVNAALVAMEREYHASALALIQRAEVLADSPVLNTDERADILSRLGK